MKSYNQAGQEQWVRQYLNDKRNGFFVDVGAYDGIESSNTYFLEKELDWDGICIESNPHFYNKLVSARKSKNINKAVMPYSGYCRFDGINTYPSLINGPNCVACESLDSILTELGAPFSIDYISLDIEGHEFEVLENFNFDKWNVNLMTIEHNLYLWGDKIKNSLYTLLSSKGYKRVVENVNCPQGPYEDWYAKNF